MKDSFVESKFNTSANDQLLYKTVVRNYCRTCHLAVKNELKPADVAKHVCSPDSAMPHAEVNAKNLLSHMDEIAAIIYKVSGNKDTSCFNMPVLNDFQWTAAEGKTITTTPSMAVAPSAIAPVKGGKGEQLNGFSVDFQAKRALKLAASSVSGSMTIEAPKIGGQYVNSMNEVTFLASPLPSDGSARIFADLFDAQGLSIGYVSSDNNSGLTPTPVVGSPFPKYTINIPALALAAPVKKIELHIIRLPISNKFNFATSLELDDVSVIYDMSTGLGQKVFAVEDFEDQSTTYATTGETALGVIDVKPYGITGTGCSNLRTSQTGFTISGAGKVGRDSGRYSLVSNPIFCVGERSQVRVKLNDSATGQKVGRFLSFDFVIDKQSDGKSPVGILNLPEITVSGGSPFDAIDVAKHQGTLSETTSQYFGHITLRAQAYFQPLSWTPLTNSGVSGAPIKGVALDNFTMWDSP